MRRVPVLPHERPETGPKEEFMKTVLKYTTAAVLAGAIALAMASPSQARNGRNAAAIGGFVAGAALGAAVANSNTGYYNNGYYYGEPGYAYEPAPVYEQGYAYEPSYAYQPAPSYYAPTYHGYGNRVGTCSDLGNQRC
jgi:hypothetical protein